VGRLNFLVIVSVSTSLGVVLLGFLLVGPLGISGVALSVLVTAWISQVILFVHTSRYLGVSVGRQFIDVQARPLLIGALFTGLAALIAGFLGSASYGQMAAGVGLAGILYGPMLYVGLHAAERKELKRILRDRIKRGPRAVE